MKPTIYLSLLAASFFVSGCVEGYMGVVGRIYSEAAVAHTLALVFLSFAWCKADVTARGIIEPSGSALGVALLPPVGVPLYFFRSKPWKAAAISTAKAIAFLAVCGGLYFAGTYAGEAIGT